MVFEHIEKLKQQFTDKYVVVDEACPELRRFSGMTGLIKTVNMNGRALVEFDAHNNIGWYDIEIDFLKLIDKPLPKAEKTAAPAEKKKAAKKPAVKEPSNLEKARASDGKQTGAGASVSDVLAAARGGQAAAPKATTSSAPDTGAMSVADVLAAARGGKSAPATPAPTESPDVAAIMEAARKPKSGDAADKPATTQKKDSRSMSVEEMMAAARGQTAPQADVADQSANDADQPAPVAEEPESGAPTDPPVGELPNDVAGIVAWCKQRDGA